MFFTLRRISKHQMGEQEEIPHCMWYVGVDKVFHVTNACFQMYLLALMTQGITSLVLVSDLKLNVQRKATIDCAPEISFPGPDPGLPKSRVWTFPIQGLDLECPSSLSLF